MNIATLFYIAVSQAAKFAEHVRRLNAPYRDSRSKRHNPTHQMRSMKTKRPIGPNGGQGGRKGERR